MEMLRRVPCFTNAKLSSTKILDFLPFTKRISVNLGGDPLIFLTAQLSIGTPEFEFPTFSNFRIARFKRLRKW